MNIALAIFVGGGLGALSRHYLALLSTGAFPYGTLVVNVLGCFLMGLLLEGLALKWNISIELKAFLVTGFLGGFTTFSAFSFDFFRLTETGHASLAVLYAGASVILSLAGFFAGLLLIRGLS